jgi:ribosome production factor 2
MPSIPPYICLLICSFALQTDAHSFSRKNPDVKPFESGGEAPLEFFCNKSNCSLFVLGSHSKKRPHNVTLGRLYDFHLYDALELGVESHKPISSFKGAGTAQVGNKVGACGRLLVAG